jgi:hypothetical protein
MADSDADEIFDDLDAFFSAAAKADPGAMQEAAQNVAEGAPRNGSGESSAPLHGRATSLRPKPSKPTAVAAKTLIQASSQPAIRTSAAEAGEDLDGKFIAIDPESFGHPHDAGGDPFVLIPAHIHSLLPWWGWVTIVLGIVVLVTAVVLIPMVSLERLTARLGDANQRNAESAMRQLVLQGDERTVGKLYDLAASPGNGLTSRLRAVDTLSLIQAPDADRALLRLELADGTDSQVREAAVAARRQREAAKTRTRGR